MGTWNKEARRRWRAKNKERIAAENRQYRKNRKEFHKRNPDKNAEYVQRWKERNAEYIASIDNKRNRCAKDAKRRALLAGNGGSFTAEEFAALGNICAYCGEEAGIVTADHIVPLSRGGSNGIDNIAPACPSCNSSKRDMTGEEFLASTRLARLLRSRKRAA